MLAILLCCALLYQQKSDKPPKSPAEEYCEITYAIRKDMIRRSEEALAELPSRNDFSKMSAAARKKIEKPYRDTISAIKADRQCLWFTDWPSQALDKQVFKLPRTNERQAVNDSWKVAEVLDKSTVLAVSDGSHAINGRSLGIEYVVIADLKPGEFVERNGSTLKLTGVWHRIEDIKIQGEKYVQIARWPHEDAVKKLWPKYLESREKEDFELREFERRWQEAEAEPFDTFK